MSYYLSPSLPLPSPPTTTTTKKKVQKKKKTQQKKTTKITLQETKKIQKINK